MLFSEKIQRWIATSYKTSFVNMAKPKLFFFNAHFVDSIGQSRKAILMLMLYDVQY